MAATAEMTLIEIRKGLYWRKKLDTVFIVAGLLILFACLGLLAALFLDLVHRGASRFGWDFITNFPSRKAERAGILSAWVGTSLIMLVTALVALPVGVAAAIYLEEYSREELVHEHRRDQRDQSRRRAIDRVWPAGTGPVRLHVRARARAS